MMVPNLDRYQMFSATDKVRKGGGDYTFEGWVMAAFQKRSGAWRYAVENMDGVLHIFGGHQLALIEKGAAPPDA